MLKYLVGCFCFLISFYPSFAQVLTPLDSYPIQHSSSAVHKRNARTTAVGDTLNLPFFDDFAAYTGKPSDQYWLEEGGVYINNQFGIRPPSIHVATFEGVDAEGLPYSNFSSFGYTDALTSKPIYLDVLNPTSDKVYFSFYWQAGGLGGAPDINSASQPSFLALEFKNKNGNWISVWQQSGENQRTEFAQVIIPVDNPDYFYKGFQFRFRSSGARRGTGDTWNVDYIYLDKNRGLTKPNRADVALSQRLNSLLERYTAMPAEQFLVRPEQEINDSAYTRLNSFSSQFAAITWRGFVKALAPAAPADTFLRGNAAISPFTQQYLITGKPNASAIPTSSSQLRIRHAIFLNTREPDARLRQNDTVSRITELSDYFAYDDGTAETNFSLNNFGARQLAYRFDLNKPGHVRSIRVYITKTNTPGTIMTFRIWNEQNGRPAETTLAQKAFTIPPIDSLNRFYEIVFSPAVAVTDTFNIGFSLTAAVNNFVNIGFDLNEQAPGRIKFNNAGTGWQTFDDEKGALMMRPVMGLVTGIGKDLADKSSNVKVYPNPSSGIFKLEGAFQELLLTDLTGRVIWQNTKAAKMSVLDLRHFPKGIYLLRITQKNNIETRKLVLTN